MYSFEPPLASRSSKYRINIGEHRKSISDPPLFFLGVGRVGSVVLADRRHTVFIVPTSIGSTAVHSPDKGSVVMPRDLVHKVS